MSKARLVKKEDIRPEMLQRQKSNRRRKAPKQQVRTAVEVTKEWINKQRAERPCAREAFEALFNEAEPQSA